MPQTRYFDCYNAFGKSHTDLIANAAFAVYGANNASEIAKLKALGWNKPIIQYWNGNGCEHGGMANLPLPLVLDPTKKFKSNNIVGIEGGNELIRLLTDHRDWFVQYPDGRIVESLGRWSGNMYFDLTNTEVQAYWLQQLDKHMLPDATGVFLDNLGIGFTAMSPDFVTTKTYGAGDSAKFLDAQIQWIDITRDHLTATGKKVYANISRSHKNPDYFKRLCVRSDGTPRLDGVMIEQAFSPNTLSSDLDLIQYLTAHGVEVLIVAQCEPHETALIAYYTACYKLVECPLTVIRYSKDDKYGNWWIPEFAIQAEQLLTPDTDKPLKQGEIAMRRFHGGYVYVNTVTREYGVELLKPMPVAPKPWIAPIAYKSSEARERSTVQVHAKAVSGGALSYAIQSVPAHDFRIYESGIITHGYSASGDYLVTVMVFEEGGGMAEVSFVWSIRTPYDVQVIPLDNSGIEIAATKGGKLLARVQLTE